MIILMLTISLTFSAASESLRSSSSTVPHCLLRQQHNYLAAPPPTATKTALPKIRHHRRSFLMDAVTPKSGFFLAKKINLTNREHLGSPSVQ